MTDFFGKSKNRRNILVCSLGTIVLISHLGCTDASPVQSEGGSAGFAGISFSAQPTLNITIHSPSAAVSIPGECSALFVTQVEWSSDGSSWENLSSATPATGDGDCSDGGFSVSIADISHYLAFGYQGQSQFLFFRGQHFLGYTAQHFVKITYDSRPKSLYLIGPTSVYSDSCDSLTVTTLNSSNQSASATTSLLLDLQRNGASGSFYDSTDTSCTGATIATLTLASGTSTTQVRWRDSLAEQATLAISDRAGNLGGDALALTVYPGNLALSHASSALSGECLAVDLTAEDGYGNSATPMNSVTANLSGQGSGSFFAPGDSACSSGGVSSLTFASGSSLTFYYLNPSSEGVTLSVVDSAGHLSGDTGGVNVGPSQLFFSGPGTAAGGSCQRLDVIAQDSLSQGATSFTNITVDLTDSSPITGTFYGETDFLCAGGATSQVTISAGSSAASFYYKNFTAQTATLSLADAASLLSGATLGFTVTPGTSCAGATTFDHAGSGANGDPYLLCEPQQIDDLTLRGCGPSASAGCSSYFKLEQDIDLSSLSGMLAIGSNTNRFGGDFDGSGFTISGLTISQPGSNYQGLFAVTDVNSSIHDLYLDQISIDGNLYVGSLVGLHRGDIQNVHVKRGSLVVGTSNNVGGLVGYLHANSSLQDSSSRARVIGSATGAGVGGLVGFAYQGTLISNCFASGNVSNSGTATGGLVGRANGGGTGLIETSFATGDVKASGQVGGLVGFLEGTTLRNTAARGNVEGSSKVGGLIGERKNSGTAVVEKSFSVGEVTCSSLCGGFAGTLVATTEADFSNNYWNVLTSGFANADDGGLLGPGQAEGKTSTQLYAQATFSSWDFTNIWSIDEGNNNPVLQGSPWTPPVTSHIAFVTNSTNYNGNLGGLAGADAKCQNFAQSAGFVRTFKAILSDSTTDASGRIAVSKPVRNTARELVATNASDLWDGTLTNAIDFDETGVQSTTTNVWTGTLSTGLRSTSNPANFCGDWGATSGSSVRKGYSDRTNSQWVQAAYLACSVNAAELYCISQ